MDARLLSNKFNLMLIDGKELIMGIQPTGAFVRLAVVTACLTGIGIVAVPLMWVLASIA